MLQRALDIYRSKFMPSLQPRKNSHRTAPIPPPPPTTTTTMSQQTLMSDLVPTSSVPLTADALSAQNALYEQTNPAAVGSPAMSNMSGTTESLDFADCFSLAEEEPSNQEDEAAAAEATAVFCNMLLQQEPMSFMDTSLEDTPGLRMNSTSSYSSDSTACTPSPSTLPIEDPFTADFFDQFMLPTDDPFYMMDTNELSKLYSNNTIDTSPFSLDPLF